MEIRRIDPSVLRRLTALEILEIPKFDMNVQELMHLKKIEHVHFLFDRIEIFTAFVKHIEMNGTLSSYVLVLDEHVDLGTGNGIYEYIKGNLSYFVVDYATFPRMNYNKFAKTRVEVVSSRNFPMLPGDVDELFIIRNEDITTLCDSLSSSLILKTLWLEDVRNIKSLFASGTRLPSFFSLSNLTTLIIHGCPKINQLFSVRMLSYLQKIEKIIILDCEGLKEVIEVGNDVMVERDERTTHSYALPKLTFLEFQKLPELKSICGSEIVLECVSLQKIEISACPKLRRMSFSLHKQQQPRLYLLGSDVEWLSTLDWDPPESEWLSTLDWDPPESKSMVAIQSGKLHTRNAGLS